MTQQEKQRVVVIGGGNGSAKSILALKPYVGELSLSAVIPMSDSGGSSGILRKEFGTLAAGDILRATLAMSRFDYDTLRKIFYKTRFDETAGKLAKHNLGNLFLVLAQQYDGDFEHALSALHQAMQAVGSVMPVTLAPSDLCVELSNGSVVVGEHEIDSPAYDRTLRIRRAWLDPAPMIYASAKEAIEKADVVILGPGSLYTSIIAALCVEGMKDALRASKAKFIFIAGDAYQKGGETGPTALSETITELEAYLPRPLDAIVVGNDVLTQEQRSGYESKGWLSIAVDVNTQQDSRIVAVSLQRDDAFGISPEKLGRTLSTIVHSS